MKSRFVRVKAVKEEIRKATGQERLGKGMVAQVVVAAEKAIQAAIEGLKA